MLALTEENALFKIGQQIKDKLHGFDGSGTQLSVRDSIDLPIRQAANNANIAQRYKSWFP
jgi:hypothetical protein